MKKDRVNSRRELNTKRLYKIKVVARDSGRVMVHDDVPSEHVELMRINPNLKVYILDSRYKFGNRTRWFTY